MSRNPNIIDNGYKPMNEQQFNHQQYNQMPVTIDNSNKFTNRQFQQAIPNKMMSNIQPFSSPQQLPPIPAQMPQQDLFVQIAEMKKMIDELKNDSLKKDEEIRALFKNSGKLSPSIVGLSRDDDDEFQIFAPIPIKSELQAELQDLLILQAQHNGSDMHLKVGSAPMIRIEGELVPVGEEPLTSTDLRRLLLPLLTKKQKEKLVQDGQLDFSFQREQGRFRTNIYLQKGTLAAALRLVKTTIPTLEELGIPESINKALSFTSGLFLLTGPTGSGKSTSMAAMIENLNQNAKYHVITLEDPIEYVFQDKESLISQREVGIDTVSYTEGMKATLRQDPDVILLGELRDRETISQALKAAETGHLVISTLHSSNAIQTITRLIDMIPEERKNQYRSMLSSTLKAVISQKLIPRADGDGRIPACEVLIVNQAISKLISAGKFDDIYPLIVEGKGEGMMTFSQSLNELCDSGIISKDELYLHTENSEEVTVVQEGGEGNNAPASAIQDDVMMSWL